MSRTEELTKIICESDRNDAVLAAEELVLLDPESASAWAMLGICRKRVEGHKGAITALERALELGEREQIPVAFKARLQTHIGEICRREGKYERAEAALCEAIKLEPNCRRHLVLGDVLRLLERDGEALEHAKSALQFDPNDVDACCLMGMLIKESDPIEAERLLRIAITGDIDNGLAFDELGSLLTRQDRYPEAEGFLAESLSRDPLNAIKHVQLGLVRLKQDKIEEAERNYRDAVDVAPESEFPHRFMGHFYRDTDRPELAEPWYREAVDLEPEEPDAVFALAWFLYKNRRIDEATIWMEKALALDPVHESSLELKRRLSE